MAFIKVGMTAPQISAMFEEERQSRVGYAVVKEILAPFGLAATAARRHYRDHGGKGADPDVQWFNQCAHYPIKFGSGKLARKTTFIDEVRLFKNLKEDVFEKSRAFLGYTDLLDAYPGDRVAYCTKFSEFKEVFAFTTITGELGEGECELRRKHAGTVYAWVLLGSLLRENNGWTPKAMLGVDR